MNSPARSKKTSPTTKRNFSVFALCLTLAVSASQTACSSASHDQKASLRIYQAQTLILPANQPVQTTEGIYTPQTEEIWHSDATLAERERQLLNALAALRQEKSK